MFARVCVCETVGACVLISFLCAAWCVRVYVCSHVCVCLYSDKRHQHLQVHRHHVLAEEPLHPVQARRQLVLPRPSNSSGNAPDPHHVDVIGLEGSTSQPNQGHDNADFLVPLGPSFVWIHTRLGGFPSL